MENTNEVIVVPWELQRDLPKNQRNLVMILAGRPEGIYSYELFELLGHKNPSSARHAARAELQKHGLEIYCEQWARGAESLWILRKLEKKHEQEVEVIQEKKRFNVGDVVWFVTCNFNESRIRDGLYVININDLYVESGILESDKSLVRAEELGCFSSSTDAVKSLSLHSISLIK